MTRIFFVLLLLLSFAFDSSAAPMVRGRWGDWDLLQSGNSYRLFPRGYGTPGYVPIQGSNGPLRPGPVVTNAATKGLDIVSEVALPVGSALVPVVVDAAVSRAGFGAGAAALGMASSGAWIPLLLAALPLLIGLNLPIICS